MIFLKMQHLPSKNHVFRGPEGPEISKNHRKSRKERCQKAARTKSLEIWFSGLISGDFGVKRGGSSRGCFFRILRDSHDFSKIFCTLIFPLKLSANSEDFTIWGPFGAFGGPSGPLFSLFLDGSCCIFQEITFLHDFVDLFSIFSRF